MKYVYSLLLALMPAVCAMEETSATADEGKRKPLGERRIDVNRFAGKKVVYETCLNTDAKDGYSLQSTLEIRRNCLQRFSEQYSSDIDQLEELGLFTGNLTTYNEKAMIILNKIFGDASDKENQTNAIPVDFRRYYKDFSKDLNDLKQLIKEKENRPEQIKVLLGEIEEPYYIVVWMTNYYSKYRDTYLQHHH